ncbi:MAG TPA: hypothetical protein DET40_18190 [Lentisphaeria bacterium]|nr:MAG: hypothetical protein A2X45_24990 [Lentisphaerae bacterium GWF2_50_93]HCE45474.1 hypothetical protein [Lentisphaeria bacterium]
MKKMTVVMVAGCLLSGVVFLTGNSVSGQDEKPADANADKGKAPKVAPQNPAGGQGGQRQGPRNFDPEKMKQQLMDNLKESLSATDEEWKVLQPLVEKVMTLSREMRASQGRMGFGPGGRRGGPGADAAQPTTEIGKANKALEEALDNSKSTPEDVKASLTAVREAKKKSEQALAKAKEDLLKVATPRQEARLVQMGIID